MYLYAITNNEEFSDAVHRILTEQVNYIISLAPTTDDYKVKVHEIRKALKRIRAVLRLIRSDIDERIYTSENVFFRDVSRQLSSVRDLHVFKEAFDTLCEMNPNKLNNGQVHGLNTYFLNQIDAAQDLLSEGGKWQALVREMEAVQTRLNSIRLEQLGPHTIFDGVGEVYGKGQKQMIKTQRFPEDDNLHEMRKLVKQLMYLIRLMQPVAPDYYKGYMTDLKEASTALGEDHDLAALASYMSKMNGALMAEPGKDIIYQYLDKQRQQIQVDIWPLVARIYTESPKDFSRRIRAYWLLGRQGSFVS
jgi:CHAD domain-containing protein